MTRRQMHEHVQRIQDKYHELNDSLQLLVQAMAELDRTMKEFSLNLLFTERQEAFEKGTHCVRNRSL